VGKPGNNLFIAGFNFITTERDLERKFSRYGRVMDVRIVRDKRSGESRGFGFLTLERDEDADAAIKALDQTEWNGRIVLVEKAKTPTRF
jgi:RNA recognition motif-containing protein